NSSRDFATRVANINGTGGDPRLNGNFFLKASGPDQTVFGDGSVDKMTGSAGRDWFFPALADIITELHDDDLTTRVLRRGALIVSRAPRGAWGPAEVPDELRTAVLARPKPKAAARRGARCSGLDRSEPSSNLRISSVCSSIDGVSRRQPESATIKIGC